MQDFLLLHDVKLREYSFFFAWSLVLLWESALPAKVLFDSLALRWSRNILLSVFGILLNRLLFPLSAIHLAIKAAQNDWGVLNLVALPAWLHLLIALLALDAVAYLLHALLHRVPILWRIHAVHHCDKDFDCTTGLRFHPIESVIAMSARLAIIVTLGIPVIAVVIYELWAIAAAFYTHANAQIFPLAERKIRALLVTPEMHRIHHSALAGESMTNYGVVFSIWDRLFRTYRDRSAMNTEEMPIGLPWFNNYPSMGIMRLFILPLLSAPFREQAEEQTAQVDKQPIFPPS
ncbi:MAG: sterol desaturase family protein [Burkholderiales bacterium]|nr:sterol desaturase family protein [Burkholderiales bacterium]